jgi:hypothetical protein
MENLYRYFQDLDRRCLSDDLKQERCAEVVVLKRRTIESPRFKGNPIAAEVLAGRTTFVAVYDAFSHEFRGIRRFIPKSHDPDWNVRLDRDEPRLAASYGEARPVQAQLERIAERRDTDDCDFRARQEAELHQPTTEAALAADGDHGGRGAEWGLIQRHRHSI